MSRLFAVSALVAVALPVQFAIAQEAPDWELTACAPVHVQNGATPGLFGLCTAFCSNSCKVSEADTAACKVDNPDPFQVKGCACGRILDNYNGQRQETDPPMPCVLDTCPCFDEAFLTTQVAAPPFFCNDDINAAREQTLVDGRDALNCNAFAQAIRRFDAAGNPVSAMCQAFNRDRDPDPPPNPCVATLNTTQEVSFPEFEACQALVRAHTASKGLTCN